MAEPSIAESATWGAQGAALGADRLSVELVALEPFARARPSAIRVVRAPGRVNLIGEHTDYNEGYVLPAAIGLEIRMAYVPTDDDLVEITLLRDGDRKRIDLRSIPERQGDWIDYVAGTAQAMQGAGLPVHGFRGVLASDLPPSSGLSSSAALELVSAWALAGATPPTVDPMTLARIAQRAENEYVGVRCGLMDQFASACGRPDRALFLDCRSLDWDSSGLPAGVSIVVCHTGSPRRLEASEYNARRAECERAVATIARDVPNVRSLRDVDDELLQRYRGTLDATSWRRARHVIDENARVLDTRSAMATGDMSALGDLFAASHQSLRDLYEVSSPELDALVEIARDTPGVVASRMTGAGFGGCTVNLTWSDAADRLRDRVETEYPARSGRSPRVWLVQAVSGAGELVR